MSCAEPAARSVPGSLPTSPGSHCPPARAAGGVWSGFASRGVQTSMSQALTSSHISLHALSLTVGRMLSTCHPLGNGTHSTALEGIQSGQERALGPCRLVCLLAVRAWSPGGSQEPGKCNPPGAKASAWERICCPPIVSFLCTHQIALTGVVYSRHVSTLPVAWNQRGTFLP